MKVVLNCFAVPFVEWMFQFFEGSKLYFPVEFPVEFPLRQIVGCHVVQKVLPSSSLDFVQLCHFPQRVAIGFKWAMEGYVAQMFTNVTFDLGLILLQLLHHSPSISNEYGIGGDVSTILGGLSRFSIPVNA